MTMKSIKAKLAAIERLVGEVRKEVEALEKGLSQGSRRAGAAAVNVPLEAELQAEYDQLYERFVREGVGPIEEFVKGKPKAYLKFFCKANNLGVDTTKASKPAIVEAVARRMAESKAIRQRVVGKSADRK